MAAAGGEQQRAGGRERGQARSPRDTMSECAFHAASFTSPGVVSTTS